MGEVVAKQRSCTKQVRTVSEILEERGKRYGPFYDHADITQRLKEVMHTTKGWDDLPVDVKEALEMIQHKIARILNGQWDYDDSWSDVSGYAELVGRRLRKDKEEIVVFTGDGGVHLDTP